MRMIIFGIVVCTVLCWAAGAEQQTLLYDVDFSSPPHVVGQTPFVGTGTIPRDKPTSTYLGDPTVVSSARALVDQPVLFRNNDSGYQQLIFEIEDQPDGKASKYPQYEITLDILLGSLGPGINDGFSLFLGNPDELLKIHFDDAAKIWVLNGIDNDFEIGTFPWNVPLKLEIFIDVVTSELTLHIDDTVFYAGEFPSVALNNLRLSSGGYGSYVGVDNIKIYGIVPDLVSMTIEGPDSLSIKEDAYYSSISHYANGYQKDVSSSVTWSVEPEDAGTIDPNGYFQAAEIGTPSTILIKANYSEDGKFLSAQKAVNLYTPTSLEIVGPMSVGTNSSTEYSCLVHGDDGGVYEFSTSRFIWQVNPSDFAEIEDGILQCNVTETVRELTILTEATFGTVTVSGNKVIQLIPGSVQLFVPQEYPTLQTAIDAASNGWEIVVADGVYSGEGNRDIDFKGKAITIRSANGPENCIIDCQGSTDDNHVAFVFQRGEDPNSVIDGFKIIRAYGSAITCEESSPLVKNCIITDCVSTSGIIDVYKGAEITIVNCALYGNYGILINGYDCDLSLINCTLYDGRINSQDELIFFLGDGKITLLNSIIQKNSTPSYPVITIFGFHEESSVLRVEHCNFKDGSFEPYAFDVFGSPRDFVVWGEGNIDVDPQFSFFSDMRLLQSSGCIDTGSNEHIMNFQQDAEGGFRICDGNGDGTATVDIGAFEFDPEIPEVAFQSTSVKFTMLEGGENPRSHILRFRFTGKQAPWALNKVCDWLSADPTEALISDEIQEVTLTVDGEGLVAGTYQCRLNFVEQGTALVKRSIGVTFHVGSVLYVPAQFETIQAAINESDHGDTILLADGIYRGDGNRDINFKGKAITLGSENGANNCVIDCQGTAMDPHRGFLFDHREGALSVIDGLTIKNGYAYSDKVIKGGGILCQEAGPTIRNCIIKNNIVHSFEKDSFGAGISGCQGPIVGCVIENNTCLVEAPASSSDNPNGCGLYQCTGGISNCIVRGNKGGAAIYYCAGGIADCMITNNEGVGLYLCFDDISGCTISRNSCGLSSCDGQILRCVISGNSGNEYGGGLSYCDGDIIDCIIKNNRANKDGGGLYKCYGDIVRCKIIGNFAGRYGGGIYYCGEVEGCLITGNLALDDGAAISSCRKIKNSTICANRSLGEGLIRYVGGSIHNCIIRDNEFSGSMLVSSSLPSFSCVEGDVGGTGCINLDPQFESPGHWDDNDSPDDQSDDFWVEGDYHLAENSLCIDAGNVHYLMTLPCWDSDGLGRVINNQIDMGCYEFASKPDTDGDLLVDELEPGFATIIDRDFDGLSDGVEILGGKDPNVADPLKNYSLTAESDSIQKTLFFSRDGEVITLEPGLFPEQVFIGGRNVIIQSTNPSDPNIVAATIMTGPSGGGLSHGHGRTVEFLGTEDGSCKLEGLTIQGCVEFGNGGGVYGAGCEAQLIGCRVLDNVARGYGGGGIYDFDGIIEGCLISGNEALGGDGGGLANCNAKISNTVISENQSEDNGGGLKCGSGELILSDCIIQNNDAGYSGGGFYLFRTNVDIRDSVIADNSAYGEGGGVCGGWGYDAGIGTIASCEIRNNRVSRDGGGLYSFDGQIANCVISENLAGAGGGAFEVASVINCVFERNEADRSGGGLSNDSWNYSGTQMKVINCTFVDNVAPSGGGAIRDQMGGGIVANSIFVGNSKYAVQSSSGYEMIISHCLFYNNVDRNYYGSVSAENNKEEDPQFIDSDDGNYHLIPNSPCIDSGNNDYVPSDSRDLDNDGDLQELIPFDLDGNSRIEDDPDQPDSGHGEGSIIDIGVFEGPSQVFVLSSTHLNIQEGDTEAFEISLAIEPQEQVEVTVESESEHCSISFESGSLLHFDSSNYNIPQTVMVSIGEDDNYVDSELLIVIHSLDIPTCEITIYELDNDPHPDLNSDGAINLNDLAILLSFWLEDEPTVDIGPVGGDGIISLADVAVLAEMWEPFNFISEDFEIGNFSRYNWELFGNASWMVANEEPAGGLYCAKSGDIVHDQQSGLEITMYLPDGMISFYSKVSSEPGYDWLHFLIDGEERDRWSGFHEWDNHQYLISEGVYTFQWIYSKDGSVSSNTDCAWIDEIEYLPAVLAQRVQGFGN